MAAGRLHVDEVLRELTAAELREWEAFYTLEPFGEPWAQTALLASILANANRDAEKRPEPFEMGDFMPVRVELPVERATVEDDGGEPVILEEEPPWKAWKRAFAVMAEAGKE